MHKEIGMDFSGNPNYKLMKCIDKSGERNIDDMFVYAYHIGADSDALLRLGYVSIDKGVSVLTGKGVKALRAMDSGRFPV